jgi:hypothetical protein
LAALLTVGGAGIAFAYWSAQGEGAGTATTGTSSVLVIAGGTPVGTIAPGGAGQTVPFTVTNPGPGIQTVGTITVTLAEANGDQWVPDGDCLFEDYSVEMTVEPPATAIAVNGSVSGAVVVTLANTALNQDDCQGQAVPLYFTTTPIP